MHATLLSLLALTASLALAQSDASCIPMCMQVKFVEAEKLAPACARSDLACLCSVSLLRRVSRSLTRHGQSTQFGNAYRRCLSDNCASANETTAGKELFGQICSQAFVGIRAARLD
jgi:hypothetical protein